MSSVLAPHDSRSVRVPPAPVAAPTPAGLSKVRLAAVCAAPLVLLALTYGPPLAVYLGNRSPAPVVATAEPDGPGLYRQHCASCHGERGDGNGTALLDPRARYFGYEKFKLGTTTNGVPTDDDLVRVLRRGVPGSAMPAFGHLPDDHMRAVVGHVRSLARAGLYERLRRKAAETGDEFFPDEASVTADRNSLPGQPLPLPSEFAAVSPESVARGQQVYLSDSAGCAKCHGPEGHGDGPQVKDLRNEDFLKTPARPRDLTQGVFKGGRDHASLYARIMLGIPGTPMPATAALPRADVDALIDYIRSLSQPTSVGMTAK